MASACKQSENVRKRKARTRGKERKNALENHGTTKARSVLFAVKG